VVAAVAIAVGAASSVRSALEETFEIVALVGLVTTPCLPVAMLACIATVELCHGKIAEAADARVSLKVGEEVPQQDHRARPSSAVDVAPAAREHMCSHL